MLLLTAPAGSYARNPETHEHSLALGAMHVAILRWHCEDVASERFQPWAAEFTPCVYFDRMQRMLSPDAAARNLAYEQAKRGNITRVGGKNIIAFEQAKRGNTTRVGGKNITDSATRSLAYEQAKRGNTTRVAAQVRATYQKMRTSYCAVPLHAAWAACTDAELEREYAAHDAVQNLDNKAFHVLEAERAEKKQRALDHAHSLIADRADRWLKERVRSWDGKYTPQDSIEVVGHHPGIFRPTRGCSTPRLWLLLVGHFRTFHWTQHGMEKMARHSSYNCYMVSAVLPEEICVRSTLDSRWCEMPKNWVHQPWERLNHTDFTGILLQTIRTRSNRRPFSDRSV